jgi:hypothetical protein
MDESKKILEDTVERGKSSLCRTHLLPHIDDILNKIVIGKGSLLSVNCKVQPCIAPKI